MSQFGPEHFNDISEILRQGHREVVKEEPDFADNKNWKSYEEAFGKVFKKIWHHYFHYAMRFGTAPTLATFRGIFEARYHEYSDHL